MTPHEQISSEILRLQEMLLAQNPAMPTLLRTIHKELQANPDVVTLLAEEEIASIISGLEKFTKTELVTATKKVSTKPIRSMSTLDL